MGICHDLSHTHGEKWENLHVWWVLPIMFIYILIYWRINDAKSTANGAMTNLELDDWSPHLNLDFQFANMKRRLFLPDFFVRKIHGSNGDDFFIVHPEPSPTGPPFNINPLSILKNPIPVAGRTSTIIDHHWPSMILIWWYDDDIQYSHAFLGSNMN